MILLDASGLIAALNEDERLHSDCAAALNDEVGSKLLSPFIAAEVDYLLATKIGQDAELAFLGEVSRRAYDLAVFDAGDVAKATSVIERYSDQKIGLADASIVVLAERYGTTRILTLDRRHFEVLRPLQGGRFEILP